MKKSLCYIAVIIIFAAAFTGCSSIRTGNGGSSKASLKNADVASEISVQSPMTLSNNNLFPVTGEHQYLRLQMIKGKYYEQWDPSAQTGTFWEGDFILELVDESGIIISKTDLSSIYKEPMIFNSSFSIEFDDYNNDGNYDFTLGQYASSNGREYKLFTINASGKIEELPVKGYSTLFISNTTGYYSTKLTKIDKLTFKKEYYDNSKGRNFEDIFKWNTREFINIESKEIG